MSMIGAFVGGYWSNPNESKLKGVVGSLVPAMERLIPVIDNLDSQVTKLVSSGTDEPPEVIVELLRSIDNLEKKVSGIEDNVNGLPKKLEDMLSRLEGKYSGEKGGGKEIKDKGFDSESRRVLCVNRKGEPLCIPNVGNFIPIVQLGNIRECTLLNGKLTCGIGKKFQ